MAGVDEVLEGGAQRFGQLGLVLRDDDAVQRGLLDLADRLEGAAGAGDGVGGDRGVGHQDVALAAGDVGRGVGVRGVGEQVVGGLTGVAALLGALDRQLLLVGAHLQGDPPAAEGVGVDVVGVPGLHGVGDAGLEVGDHRDGLEPLGVDREARDADVVGGADGGDDLREHRRLGAGGQPQHGTDRGEDVDVVADRLAAGADELARRVVQGGAVDQLAALADRLGHQLGDLGDLGDGGEVHDGHGVRLGVQALGGTGARGQRRGEQPCGQG